MIPANTPPPLRILAEHSRRLGGKIRGGNFAVRFDGGGMTLDLSNQSIDDSALRALLNFARARQLKDEIAAMMSGEKVNFTERLPALHPALRGTIMTQISPKLRGQIADERKRFLNFAHRLREGEIVGARGNRFCDVVNIGMGGSESGARLIATALENSNSPVRAHFVGDADGGGIKKTLAQLHPETTFFIISSKSFATKETLADADAARGWIKSKLGDAASKKHFVGVSAKPNPMREWGIAAANQFCIWGGVGGRFSAWSAMGLAAAIHIGESSFNELLDGANRADKHFKNAPLARNLPVLLALADIWNFNFNGAQSKVILPYDFRLRNLIPYLMQLEMESLGKTLNRKGEKANLRICAPVWGDLGWRARHSFFQMLLQGGGGASADIISVKKGIDDSRGIPQIVGAHSRLFSRGKRDDNPHLEISGGLAHSILTLDELTPRNLGALMAVFEHKIFAQGALCGINPFNQPAVEGAK